MIIKHQKDEPLRELAKDGIEYESDELQGQSEVVAEVDNVEDDLEKRMWFLDGKKNKEVTEALERHFM